MCPPACTCHNRCTRCCGRRAADRAFFTRLLIVVEDGASVTYVHEAASPTEPEGHALHAGIVELVLGAGAQLTFVELQTWGEHVWNITHERANVARDGRLDWIFGAVGSQVTKNFSELNLTGQGAEGRMSGLLPSPTASSTSTTTRSRTTWRRTPPAICCSRAR